MAEGMDDYRKRMRERFEQKQKQDEEEKQKQEEAAEEERKAREAAEAEAAAKAAADADAELARRLAEEPDDAELARRLAEEDGMEEARRLQQQFDGLEEGVRAPDEHYQEQLLGGRDDDEFGFGGRMGGRPAPLLMPPRVAGPLGPYSPSPGIPGAPAPSPMAGPQPVPRQDPNAPLDMDMLLAAQLARGGEDAIIDVDEFEGGGSQSTGGAGGGSLPTDMAPPTDVIDVDAMEGPHHTDLTRGAGRGRPALRGRGGAMAAGMGHETHATRPRADSDMSMGTGQRHSAGGEGGGAAETDEEMARRLAAEWGTGGHDVPGLEVRGHGFQTGGGGGQGGGVGGADDAEEAMIQAAIQESLRQGGEH